MNKAVDERQLARQARRRKEGVDYKLRVIPHSGGMLELVEVEPRPNPFLEWARVMQLTGWSL